MKLPNSKFVRILPYIWVFLLALTLMVSAQSTYRRSLQTTEFAYACDPFGYLRMAREIRTAAGQRQLPEFRMESAQTRLLINFMQEQKVPVPDWEEVVAPHAHHFFPKSNYVGVQYPPGTGLTLALFPEGQAVYGLNKTVVASFLAIGIAALAFAAWRQAWFSTGLVLLTIHLGLSILGRMGALSFSINAVLIPLLLSCLLSVAATRLNGLGRIRLAVLTAFAAGLLLGLSTLIRLPVLFLTPGFLALLWPKTWRIRPTSLPVVFALGVVLFGVIPVLWHQHIIAGAWYLPTYASIDAALPTMERLGHNLSYFFGDGPATEDNWAIRDAVIGLAGFVILLSAGWRSPATGQGLTWKRVGLAALVAWMLSTIFFLTHWVVGPHYAIPGVFVTVALIAFGLLAIESTTTRATSRFDLKKPLIWIGIVLALWPVFTTSNRAWTDRTSIRAPAQPVAHAIEVPAELADARAWIWADLLTGSLWYYANKPAYKIQFTNPETRAKIFKFVFDRGEPQYLIQDSERMQTYIDEIEALGGTVEMKGKIDGHNPYFLIHWPASGPATDRLASK